MSSQITNLTYGQRICASALIIRWGVLLFVGAAAASLAAMIICGLACSHFGLRSEFSRAVSGVLAGGVFLLVILLSFRLDKSKDFVVRSSVALVQRFSRQPRADE